MDETEKAYFVMDMTTYKDILTSLNEEYPHTGIWLAIPCAGSVQEEFDNPTPLDGDIRNWQLVAFRAARPQVRKRSIAELLFCMLRAAEKGR